MNNVLSLRTCNESLEWVRQPVITSGNEKIDKLQVEFGPEWDFEGAKYHASFFLDDPEKTIDVELDDDFSCDIPIQMLLKPGVFHFGVWCETDGEEVKSSEIKCFVLLHGIKPTNNAGWWEGVPEVPYNLGIYVGTGEMPRGYNVQIDPDGEVVLIPTKLSELENDVGFMKKISKAYITDSFDEWGLPTGGKVLRFIFEDETQIDVPLPDIFDKDLSVEEADDAIIINYIVGTELKSFEIPKNSGGGFEEDSSDEVIIPGTDNSFGKRLWSASKKKNVYEAWPFGNAWFDKETGKHCLIFNTKTSHTSVDGDVYFTSKHDFEDFTSPILVAQHTSQYGCRCHGAGIDKNGNYIALVLHYPNTSGDGNLYVYKSINKGATWQSYELLIKQSSGNVGGEIEGAFVSAEFEKGAISSNDGANQPYNSQSPRIRTIGYINSGITQVSAIDDYYFSVFVYGNSSVEFIPTMPVNFTNGTINDNDNGTIANGGSTRIYSEYLNKTVTQITANEGHYFSVHLYNASGSYIGAYDGENIGTFAWLQNADVSGLHSSGYKIRIMVKKGEAGTSQIKSYDYYGAYDGENIGTFAWLQNADVSGLHSSGYNLKIMIKKGEAGSETVSVDDALNLKWSGEFNSDEDNIVAVNLLSGETGSCFLTKSGRLLSFDRLAPSPNSGCMIIYSDDNGESWSGTKINNGEAPNPLEGSFIELSNGNIYCVVRGNLYTGNFTTLQKTYITKSTDNGKNWTTLVEMTDIDATFNGVALIHHTKTKKIEMVYASRLLQPNGCGSLYRRICTEEEFEAGNYGEEVKIANGGSVGADFGYVAASVSDKNVVNMYYYITDETDGGTCIRNAELDWIY